MKENAKFDHHENRENLNTVLEYSLNSNRLTYFKNTDDSFKEKHSRNMVCTKHSTTESTEAVFNLPVMRASEWQTSVV